jgi:hypothetical protein
MRTKTPHQWGSIQKNPPGSAGEQCIYSKPLVVPAVAEQGQAVTTAHFPTQCVSLGSVRPVLQAQTLELDELWIPEQRNGIRSDEVGFIPC